MQELEPQLIGQRLIEKGFKTFVLYLFRLIEGRKVIVEPLHNDLFEYFEKIYNGKITRCCISLPPRSMKTTLCIYFLVYTLTQEPKSQIIYTSYSQSLLNEISNKVASILENPIYKALFPGKIYIEENESKPVDEFWKDYLYKETGKNVYSSKLIRTYQGGVVVFQSIGGQILGHGVGLRGSKKFSGILIIDDANKSSDIRSKVICDNVKRYFTETLLSRLNNPDSPILNVQQRLSLSDLTQYLIDEFQFDVLRKPLLDEDGNCNLPSQYTEQRIKELQVNNFMFQAQYMQQPIPEQGAVIKTDWFGYYPLQEYDYTKIVIAADTAMTVKESADYTAFIVGGVTPNGKLHIIDLVHGRFEFPELKQELVKLYNKYQYTDGIRQSCNSVVIENKASGIQLIQELQSSTCLPIIPIDVTKDKLTRVEEILDYIASGNNLLPVDKSYGFNPTILNECAEFNREQT
ncbi:MAG: phage terminase large subunit, partial [Clostridia bacterium]|nr:phage terminase large subunit [Clostridia bacterium]